VFGALLDMKMSLLTALRLITCAITVSLTVLASLGTVTAFFNFCTSSFVFIQLLNVFLFAVSGFVGLWFLSRTMANVRKAVRLAEGNDSPEEQARAALRRGLGEQDGVTGGLFMIWGVLFALVGAQMGWVLRPFIGDPDMPFALFRERSGNFLSGFLSTLGKLLESGS
jgi:hypothetical protein